MKIKSFIRESLAHLTGDTDKVIAERNYRMASAIVGGQIHALNAQKIKEEVALDKAEKALSSAKFPGFEIDDDSEYLENIHECALAVETAKENLEDTLEAIQFNKDLLKEFDEDVDAPAEEKK